MDGNAEGARRMEAEDSGAMACAAAMDAGAAVAEDSSDDELPFDDGRTPGRTAGWNDGKTDEERNLDFMFDPKADEADEIVRSELF
eukprot:SAG11_NODE_1598_length_4610_cov_2.897362_6_plen_86_part_00